MTGTAYDPATVPAWAREAITQIARDHPDTLPHHLNWVAEIEEAKQRTAGHPPALPAPPQDPRDFLHLCAIQAWQAMASGKPAPVPDLPGLRLDISDAFQTPDRHNLVDQVYDTWHELARQHGIPVYDDNGGLLPGLEDAIAGTITAAIWFGITTGYFTIAGGRYHVPRKFAGWA